MTSMNLKGKVLKIDASKYTDENVDECCSQRRIITVYVDIW